MKVVILAGGLGTRLGEETVKKPKPMVEVGEKPILWHIMKTYYHYGFNEFIICGGYKQNMIKDFFNNYFLYNSDVTFDNTLSSKVVSVHNTSCEKWKVTVVDTGRNSMTGGRIRRIKKFIGNEPFMLTYGDGVADVNIKELIKFHKENGKMVTLTAIQPDGRFGSLDIGKNSTVNSFIEKPIGDNGWINGGYFVCQPEIFDYLENDSTIWERKPLETIASKGELCAYQHRGFWHAMDTLKDKQELEKLWQEGKAPWKVWKDEHTRNL